MTRPTTPLTDEVREWIAYGHWLKTRAGFMVTYSLELDKIWHSKRLKKGLRLQAYEAAEIIYQDTLRMGRKYPDYENFRDAWYDHCKSPTAKV